MTINGNSGLAAALKVGWNILFVVGVLLFGHGCALFATPVCQCVLPPSNPVAAEKADKIETSEDRVAPKDEKITTGRYVPRGQAKATLVSETSETPAPALSPVVDKTPEVTAKPATRSPLRPLSLREKAEQSRKSLEAAKKDTAGQKAAVDALKAQGLQVFRLPDGTTCTAKKVEDCVAAPPSFTDMDKMSMKRKPLKGK